MNKISVIKLENEYYKLESDNYFCFRKGLRFIMEAINLKKISEEEYQFLCTRIFEGEE